jgi:energy-coupling factor transporter transmembrane protein EcfT
VADGRAALQPQAAGGVADGRAALQPQAAAAGVDTQATLQPRTAGGVDPRATAIVYLVGLVLILLATEPAELVVAASLPLVVLARLGRLRAWLLVLRFLVPTLALFAIVAGLAAGPAAGLGAALRLFALAGAGAALFAAAPPAELASALRSSGLSPQPAFLIEGTLRFIPTIGQLVGDVRDAQESRGIRLDGLALVRNLPAFLGPVLVGTIRLAESLAEALEARGFANREQTLLHDYRWTARDWAVVLAAAALGTALAAWLIIS